MKLLFVASGNAVHTISTDLSCAIVYPSITLILGSPVQPTPSKLGNSNGSWRSTPSRYHRPEDPSHACHEQHVVDSLNDGAGPPTAYLSIAIASMSGHLRQDRHTSFPFTLDVPRTRVVDSLDIHVVNSCPSALQDASLHSAGQPLLKWTTTTLSDAMQSDTPLDALLELEHSTMQQDYTTATIFRQAIKPWLLNRRALRSSDARSFNRCTHAAFAVACIGCRWTSYQDRRARLIHR